MDPKLDIDYIKKSLFINRITSELQTIEPSTERYIYLDNILKQLISSNTVDINTVIDQVGMDEYKKTWNRLSEHHKITKIKEYIIEKGLSEKIEAILIEAVNDKKLKSVKDVIYDNVNYKIIKIKFNDIVY